MSAVLDEEDPVLGDSSRRSARPRRRCGRRCGPERQREAVAARPWPRSRQMTCTGLRDCSPRTPPGPRTRITASGVAMKVFDGHSTVSPAPWRNGAPPGHRRSNSRSATAGTSFHRCHASSNRAVIVASDHRPESRTSSISVVQPRAIALIEADRKPRESGVVDAVVNSRPHCRGGRSANPPASGDDPHIRLAHPVRCARAQASVSDR